MHRALLVRRSAALRMAVQLQVPQQRHQCQDSDSDASTGSCSSDSAQALLEVEGRASRVRKALKLCAKRSLSPWRCVRCFLYSYPLSFGLLLILELNLNSSSINKEGTSYKKRQHLTKHYVTCDVMLYLRNERSKIRHGRWTVTVRPQHETGVKPTKSVEQETAKDPNL